MRKSWHKCGCERARKKCDYGTRKNQSESIESARKSQALKDSANVKLPRGNTALRQRLFYQLKEKIGKYRHFAHVLMCWGVGVRRTNMDLKQTLSVSQQSKGRETYRIGSCTIRQIQLSVIMSFCANLTFSA